jgi:hypothetical protein
MAGKYRYRVVIRIETAEWELRRWERVRLHELPDVELVVSGTQPPVRTHPSAPDPGYDLSVFLRAPTEDDEPPPWQGQVFRDRATGRELMRNHEGVLEHQVGSTIVVEGKRYTVVAVEDDGDTVLLDKA